MTTQTLTIRRATDADAVALYTLAALDSKAPLTGDVLIADVGDEPWAAISLDSGRSVADPFRASGEIVDLLRFRAESFKSERSRGAARLRLLPRTA